jgi:hypothetical protein
MAAQYRSISARQVGNSTGTTFGPGAPTGYASGDFLLGFAIVDIAAASLTTIAGWTVLYSGTPGGGFRYNVCYIVRGASAPTLVWGKTTGTHYTESYIIAVQSTSALSLVLDSQSASGATGSASGHNPDPPSTTAVASASVAVCGGVHWQGSSSSWIAPSGYTLRAGTSGGDDLCMATKALSASGAENPGAFTGVGSGANSYWDGFTITIAESAGGGGATAKNAADNAGAIFRFDTRQMEQEIQRQAFLRKLRAA